MTAIGRPGCRNERRRALLRGLPEDFENISDMIRELNKDRSDAFGMLDLVIKRKIVDAVET